MDRGLAVGNKICAKREEQRRHELHRDRIRKMKPTVSTTTPSVSSMDHVRNNLKKEQMLEERYSEIDRENRILLKKMSDIMKSPSYTSSSVPGPVSLNRDFRKKELLKITQENQAILKRIQGAQPIYNHVEWEGHHRRNQGYMANSCEYPVILRSRPRGVTSQLVPISAEDPQDSLRSVGDFNVGAQSSALPEMPAGGRPTDDEQKYVLKEGTQIGETYYLVEMSTDGRSLTISAYDGASQTTLELVVKEKNHRKLYREMNGDYSQIAARLRVDGNRLILDGGGDASALQELDADSMVMHAKSGSAGSVNAEIDLNASGDQPRVHIRGLTPSSVGVPSPSQSPEPQ